MLPPSTSRQHPRHRPTPVHTHTCESHSALRYSSTVMFSLPTSASSMAGTSAPATTAGGSSKTLTFLEGVSSLFWLPLFWPRPPLLFEEEVVACCSTRPCFGASLTTVSGVLALGVLASAATATSGSCEWRVRWEAQPL